jgi:hypothetical protein
MKKNNTKKDTIGLAFSATPNDYNIFDLRSGKPTYYVDNIDDDGSVANSNGIVFHELDEIKFSASNTMQYFSPNNVGILLSITNKTLIEAKEIYTTKIDPTRFNHTVQNVSSNKKEHIVAKSKDLYDFIEKIQSCLVFAYTSLEAFANLSIPESYRYEAKIESKGIIEVYDKVAIERWITLKQKLAVILVDIYDTEDLTNKSFWAHFIKLEQYRHDIIHQKSIDRVEFYKVYFNRDIFKVCTCAEEIINFFYIQHAKKNKSNPLWPWLVNSENAFPVKKFDSKNFEVIGNLYER